MSLFSICSVNKNQTEHIIVYGLKGNKLLAESSLSVRVKKRFYRELENCTKRVGEGLKVDSYSRTGWLTGAFAFLWCSSLNAFDKRKREDVDVVKAVVELAE